MHIVEGYLPVSYCILWFIIAIIFVAYGIKEMKTFLNNNPESKSLLAVSGLVMLIFTFIRLPSLNGAASHPTGNGLGGAVFGPAITSVLAAIVLLLQAFIFAYGGLTTLGANIVSLGIVGPFVAWIVYKKLINTSMPSFLVIFLSGVLANIFSYLTTAFQFALAFPGDGFLNSFVMFSTIFSVVQIPLALIFDGFIILLIWGILKISDKVADFNYS